MGAYIKKFTIIFLDGEHKECMGFTLDQAARNAGISLAYMKSYSEKDIE